MVESVYCAVRTDSLYKADYVSSLKGLSLLLLLMIAFEELNKNIYAYWMQNPLTVKTRILRLLLKGFHFLFQKQPSFLNLYFLVQQ